MMKGCRPLRGAPVFHGSWGSASLHPRLYAVAALRGLKHPSLLSYTSTINGGFHKKFRGSRPKLSKLTGLADLNNGENQIRPANIFLGQGWLRIRRRESNQPAGSGPVTGQQPTPERVAARAYSEEPGDRSL